ncbi:DUF6162 family protein [Ferrimonas lipolytica]|uniref:Uncharacterized protein n=1 Tax=Ferrimonas lipolytica TaxID=2724191 RepID=A0A6H1UEP8_9GAMM|nr:hypothetical protein [Ferrimonas lipolytica]QIZ77070.1 hypothetical protein HER31_09350 [Ferrimonas lipolytica]
MITKVKPDNGAREGRYLALAIAIILAIGALALPHHQSGSNLSKLSSNQIAVEQLPKTQLPPLRELNIANEELQFYQQDEQRWPTVAELTDEFIAPFSDQQWQWQQPQHGIYLGHNGQWSLLLDAVQQQIWLRPSVHAPFVAPLDHYLEGQWQHVLFNLGNDLGDTH